jgi:hypothetical protein
MVRIVAALAACICLWSAAAGAAEYDPRRAGHPLRVAAYAVHPFGVMLDLLIFRPAWEIGQHEPFRTLFGVKAPLRTEPVQEEPVEEPSEPAP